MYSINLLPCFECVLAQTKVHVTSDVHHWTVSAFFVMVANLCFDFFSCPWIMAWFQWRSLKKSYFGILWCLPHPSRFPFALVFKLCDVINHHLPPQRSVFAHISWYQRGYFFFWGGVFILVFPFYIIGKRCKFRKCSYFQIPFFSLEGRGNLRGVARMEYVLC